MAVEEGVDATRLTCGLRTTWDVDNGVAGFRVGWIAWDSPFRDTELRIEDRIVAVDGLRYDAGIGSTQPDLAVGQAREHEYWNALGAVDGRPVELDILRDDRCLRVCGAVAATRTWHLDGSRLLAPTGPARLARDGFASPWGTWYEQAIEDTGWKILDGSLRRSRPNTRMELDYHRRRAPRVAFLAERYPGRFAETVVADYRRIEEYLAGTKYDITAGELEWRSIGEARAQAVAAAAEAAMADYRARNAARLRPAFPLADALDTEARASLAGNVVELPPLGLDDWLMAAGEAWMVSEGEGGRYFVAAQSPTMRRFFAVLERYRRNVQPLVPERYRIFGCILGNPKMFVRDRRPLPGLELEPLAACAGEAVFVDLESSGDAAVFAGERELVDLERPLPSADAPPGEVLAAFFGYLKLGEEQEWRAMFADWEAALDEDRPWFFAQRPPDDEFLSAEWVRARRIVAGKVFDLRPVRTAPARRLFEPDPELLVPAVDQAEVEVDVVGLFDGEHRAFADADVHRLWRLQRIDGGPWRIAASSRHGV